MSFLAIMGEFHLQLFIGLLYLFFVPNSTLFNITFISRNNKALSETFHYNDVQLVKLNANRFDIQICESPNNDIYVQTLDKTLGYTTVKNKDMSIKSEFINNVVTYTITEPTGALFKSSSYIKLFIPNQKSIDVEIYNQITSFKEEFLKNYKYINFFGFKSAEVQNKEVLSKKLLEIIKTTTIKIKELEV